ncbi:hypothetical protein EIM44_04760 [Bibersteinia trehalosi]|uniref:Uncharacterized protein n=1 Tax=Bibersteinia trehalosi TaxID=47735 RepID=A0A3R8MHZ4_BIBTR|nr:hypothetical protein [Bibersteinia trehalosi]RRN04752.1 hypothetical protein EIM44_04760 [Bibersteinia trehalosi]
MWKKQLLKLSPQAKIALDNNLKGVLTPFSLSVKGTKIGAHNWSHGIKEQSGKYLSPENAVKAFTKKLTDYSDPNRPNGVQDVVLIMVTANDIDVFISQLERVSILLPEPTFKQAIDYAKSAKSLQDTKMVKTPTISSPAFSNNADITPGSARTMQSIMRNAQSMATAAKASNPMQAIQKLLKAKQQREQQNEVKVNQLLTTQVQIYSFADSGYLETAATKMHLNLPDASNVFTACVMFIGNNLMPIKDMLNDY